jgi:catalase
MLSGKFTPTPEAAALTRAPHAQRAATPVLVRFSNSAGIPTVADNDGEHASPRGIAIRFQLAEHVHTDIIGVSTDGFPVHTPEEFLEFLRAVHASGPDAPKPNPIEIFLSSHPMALQFVMTPKPIPTSFARERFFSVNAMKFTNQNGASKYGRYRIRPALGTEYLDAKAAAAKSPNFLFDEIAERVAKGPIQYEILVQLAEAADVVDDATVVWPEDHRQVRFGTISLTQVVPNTAEEERWIIFDPIPRVDGIDPSADPLLETRASVYLMSGKRRRGAGTGSASV